MGQKTNQIIQTALSDERINLLETEAKEVCSDYGMPVPAFEVVRTGGEASDAAQRIGFPVVLKIVSPDILHKTEAGGVLLDIKTALETEKGFETILKNAKQHSPEARIQGVMVQKMAPQGIEIIVGGLIDPHFGQTIMFGLGGVFVEVLRDVTFRVAPIVKQDAQEMIHEIKAYPILKGFRGKPPADENTIADILLRVSDLMMENQQVGQMDLNPVMVYEKGANIVDARMILQK
jgi:acetyl-CoA synthetase (ADP-forming)